MPDIASGTNRPLTVMMQAMHSALGDSPLTADLAMVAVRLVELHRVHKDTGSLYLHCDPTASHYLKLVLDAVFGEENFRSEIMWKRTSAHSGANRYGPIIAASSNPGDVVLDPFCGCGTAVDAAEKLGRRWIGIDITHIAIGMIEDRMRSGYPGIVFETIGVPRDLASAERLAAEDPHQFQQWLCWQVGGFPREKKGGDKGVDGWFNYLAADGKVKTGVISVKAGHNVNPGMVRDLGQVMKRDGHEFGLFVMKGLPTKGMRDEASSHSLIEVPIGGDPHNVPRYPALQFVTLAELFQGIRPKLPPLISPEKKAQRVETRKSHQKGAQGELL
ncbi:hypothetical protein C0V72_07570 [Porphyrobacter sp. TH134]|uniref:DNA methyltransferase n=1 Tax=Porphyrobacter sp. TH134 TaxID=2067450 RepID=UPI000C7BA5B4|nr:DNA methyltransferase [Porphyrobacter sp. TH134]PLK23903.1 hypothetical protein C0V72_07570 [Porphyrobacter sp. TH134]